MRLAPHIPITQTVDMLVAQRAVIVGVTATPIVSNGNIYCFSLLRRAASGNGCAIADGSNYHLLHFLLKYLWAKAVLVLINLGQWSIYTVSSLPLTATFGSFS